MKLKLIDYIELQISLFLNQQFVGNCMKMIYMVVLLEKKLYINKVNHGKRLKYARTYHENPLDY